MSVSGEKLMSRSISIQQGINRITIDDLKSLPSGIYQVLVNTGKKVGTARWVKL